MKLKKLVSAVACVVMAGVFATSAFAATTDQVAAAQGYLSANGISYEISSEEVDKIIANFKTEDAAKAAGDALIAQVKADPNNAASIVTNTLAGYGVTVSDVAVTVNADGTISGTATINGKLLPLLLRALLPPSIPRSARTRTKTATGMLTKRPPMPPLL